MQTIAITPIATERNEDQILAPNANNHGHVSTAFAWA
ncbi:hypothetical protein CLV85_0399 [Salinibacterium amurskyense]|uniref:Uncharacterized protein n=1 Tax=Salinibacterium amurskyense TaxID=205941 RepID=A0A2M9D6H9_9MICO|nr:hypothetical protein CLV85_0399 [Salinibacterium amurskyense]